MNNHEKKIIEQSRNYTVVKSNKLALNSRYKYSIGQQKMIAYICSKIRPADEKNNGDYQLEYEFEIVDYINLLGNERTGEAYNEIKKTLQDLRDKSCWIYDEKTGDEVLVAWLSKVRTNKKSGHVFYRLDEDLVPYLFELKEKYLSYGLYNILNFRSKYSIRFYEMLKAHYDLRRSQYRKKRYETPMIEWELEIDKLRHMLMLDTDEDKNKYKNFKDFRKYVIEAAQREINTFSNMYFTFEAITKGRKTVKVKFLVQFKDIAERIKSEIKNNERFL